MQEMITSKKQILEAEKQKAKNEVKNVSTFEEKELLYQVRNIEELIVRKGDQIEPLEFFWIDIWEDSYNYQGDLFLFGKVFN